MDYLFILQLALLVAFALIYTYSERMAKGILIVFFLTLGFGFVYILGSAILGG